MFPLEAFGGFLESVMIRALKVHIGVYGTDLKLISKALLLQDPDGHRGVKLHESEVLH